MGAVLNFVRKRERIFLRWLSEVERLLGDRVDSDVAFKAWIEGYSAAEYAGCPACLLNIAKRSLPKLILRGVGLASNDAVG